jgi:hypothetical protein
MDEKLRALLDQMPQKPPRSKLEPHIEVIRELRRRGQTYQEIAQFFAEHLNLTVSASTIHYFVRLRARRRQKPQPIELPPPEIAPTVPTGEAVPHAESDMRERIEALKQRRPSEKAERSRFEYNENEPLQLIPGTKQQE